MEERDGIVIRYGHETLQNGADSLVAKFYIGKSSSNKNFLSNPEIREAIRKLRKRIDIGPREYIGLINVTVAIKSREAKWALYFPLAEAAKEVLNIGLPDKLELKVQAEARKKIPRIRSWFHRSPEQARKNQLIKREMSHPFTYTHEEGLARLKTKIRNDTRTNRPRRLRG